MSFTPVTFGGENVTPKNDGGLYQARYGDGRLWGCGMSLTGSPVTDLTINAGELIIGGRVIAVDGATNISLSGISNTASYVQVVLKIDLSANPVLSTSLVNSATSTFPALTTGAINNNDTVYQAELAVLQASGGVATSIYSRIGYSMVTAYNSAGDTCAMRMLESGGFRIGNYDGGSVQGIGGNANGSVTVFNDGSNNVRLRPNGYSDNTGEFTVETNGNITVSGQQIGGHPMTEKAVASENVACAAATMKNLASVTGLSNTGIYLVFGAIEYTLDAAGEGYHRLGIGSDGTTMAYAISQYAATTASKYITICTISQGTGV